jgi:hypothetical protein
VREANFREALACGSGPPLRELAHGDALRLEPAIPRGVQHKLPDASRLASMELTALAQLREGLTRPYNKSRNAHA